MWNVTKNSKDGSDQPNDWESKVNNLLQEKLAKYDQEVSRMDSRFQTLSDENEVLRSELKQVQENHVPVVEGEEDIVQQDLVQETFQDDKEIPVASNNDKKRSIRRQSSVVAFFHRLTNTREEDSIYNTGTVHMHAIAVTAAGISKPTPVKSWCFALGSMLLVCCQVAVLRWLILESSYVTCNTHTDCDTGQFCKQNDRKWLNPRCLECEKSLKFWDDKNDEASEVDEDFCSAFMENEPDFDDIDQSVLWFTQDKVYHNDGFNVMEPEHIACYANEYCKDNEVADKDNLGNICDHLKLRRSRLSIDQLLVFILVALLFTSTLCDDIEESAVEEKILIFTRGLVGENQSISLSSHVLAYSLSARRYMLPWLYACATVAIMISDEYSASNILLNLLTIGFVTEADDMVATLFFSKREARIVEEFVEMAKVRGVPSVSFFWTRVLGASASILIVVVTFEVERLEKLFDNDTGVCSDIHNTLGKIFFLWVPLFYILIQGVGKPLLSDYIMSDDIHRIDRFLHAFMDLSTNLVSFCLTNLVIFFSTFAVYTSRGMWNQSSLEISVEWAAVTLIGAICFICLSICLSRCIDRRKAK